MKKFKIYLLIISCFLFEQLNAQSYNYWSWNFNTPSMMLSGAVVGGSAGVSAIYYNPALIDHENVPSLSFSASLTTLQRYNAENVVGNGIDSKKWFFKIQPKFISYTLKNDNDRIGMEVAVFSPISEESEFKIQHQDALDLIQRTEGIEEYNGYVKYKKKYQDIWAGFGFSYQLNDNMYIGASGFVSTKLMNYELSQFMEAYQNAEEVIVDGETQPRYIALNNYSEELKYWYESLIFKAGFQYKSPAKRFSAGLNLTLPAIPIYGEATVRKAFNRSNVYNNLADEFTTNESFVGFEEKVRTKVKTPFSLAVGAQYTTKNNKNSISFTAEYFNEIDQYAIINPSNQNTVVPDAFNSSSFNDFMSFYHSAESITNLAIGFKQFINDNFYILGGIRTDFDASTSTNFREVGGKFKVSQFHLDKYHITGGPVLRVKDAIFITGFQYSNATGKNLQQIINYSDPIEYNSINNTSLQGIKEDTVKATIRELTVFLGVTVEL